MFKRTLISVLDEIASVRTYASFCVGQVVLTTWIALADEYSSQTDSSMLSPAIICFRCGECEKRS